MAKDLLFEIGLEEMPARVVIASMRQLQEKTAAFLEENGLAFEEIKGYSTPRRLAVYVTNLAEKQADKVEELKGPAKKIALDAEGNWSKAAQGFVRGQGLTTEAIYFKEIKGIDYVHVTKETKGKSTFEVLDGLKEVMTSLTFPVTMHWNQYDFEYIRPIHWLVALYGDEVVPFEFLDVATGRTSRGHRFLGKDVTFTNAKEYLEKLAEVFVIADSTHRQTMIVEQIAAITDRNNWQVTLDQALLDEVNNLVEYPTAFVGNFEEKYLTVPEEVLVTSMKEHQRYFEVRDVQGALLPHFISVRNGDQNHLENVIRGNEKVLVARLEDAEFFYQEDKKRTIAECVEKLKQVTFHEKIGSIYEKMQRVQTIAKIIGEHVHLTSEEMSDLKRASEIYKFDLVTNMVGEFPELQGIMGEKYALLQGEKPSVAQALKEHYLPISSEGALPNSNIGAVLAISDKLDSLLTFFSIDMIPSGSNDPYALRRQSYGIIRIIHQKQWNFLLIPLVEQIVATINENKEKYGLQLVAKKEQVKDFIQARMKQFFGIEKIRHDIIEAVIASQQQDLSQLFVAATVLREHQHDADFKVSIEALTRVINLSRKAPGQTLAVDPTLFENEAEKDLYEGVKSVSENFKSNTLADNYLALVNLRPLIEQFFNQTMVMVDDEAIRNNRLSLLNQISKMALLIASLDQLITK
ncbi:glycine--tRNA ligase subunit beta [Enterococcus lemanii]|uniref:Glycine--tRNA ligase beta subunit n=1 Tax=Enterococcus lemanii TaxID=1159752 RepID=A0ABV9MWB3_9ENTE|nr:glycine--tRNA ligase subunit beta [Enterococcus lemanii]MBM7708763.1 glycyl-tRNA synthetase beta chain [Enterococcus lemanii]